MRPDSGLFYARFRSLPYPQYEDVFVKLLMAPAAAIERRKSIRFPIERELRYQTLNKKGEIFSGCGRTVNISSSGVIFCSEHNLPVGSRVEAWISWPAKLNEKCWLNWVVRGQVTRAEEGRLALQIERHEFRTQSASRS